MRASALIVALVFQAVTAIIAPDDEPYPTKTVISTLTVSYSTLSKITIPPKMTTTTTKFKDFECRVPSACATMGCQHSNCSLYCAICHNKNKRAPKTDIPERK